MRVVALIQTEHVHALRPGFGPNTCVRLPPIRRENVGVRVERTMTSMRERWIDDDDVYVKDCEAMVGCISDLCHIRASVMEVLERYKVTVNLHRPNQAWGR